LQIADCQLPIYRFQPRFYFKPTSLSNDDGLL
jgi:hypothetical protein